MKRRHGNIEKILENHRRVLLNLYLPFLSLKEFVDKTNLLAANNLIRPTFQGRRGVNYMHGVYKNPYHRSSIAQISCVNFSALICLYAIDKGFTDAFEWLTIGKCEVYDRSTRLAPHVVTSLYNSEWVHADMIDNEFQPSGGEARYVPGQCNTSVDMDPINLALKGQVENAIVRTIITYL